MYTLLISMAALVLGYLLYGRFVERIFKPDPKAVTPAYSRQDGVDFIPMPEWKIFMIQFLNIAGTGPIFGAIMGAMFGPACYLWIVLGCIFGGAVHDYLSGMISIRMGGEGLPGIVGANLGSVVRKVMLFFCVLMLLLVGAVFVYSPAEILGEMTSDPAAWAAAKSAGTVPAAALIWVGVVLAYYLLATLVPVDKIIGKIYPVFAIALIFMAVALFVHLISTFPAMPEIWDGLGNRNPSGGSIFPALFITIACGAVSGFHATQSPLMARCLRNEKYGRPVFYGAMITEGLIALVWATVSIWFFYGGGYSQLGFPPDFMVDGVKMVPSAPAIVSKVSRSWLGAFGSVLALLGVVAAPITSGDTALRSARLIIADALKLDQQPLMKRLAVSVPVFAVTGLLLWFELANHNGFMVVWQYFGWGNQTLAVFTLWALTSFLSRHRDAPAYLITLIPACFMTAVCVTFISTAKIGFGLPASAIPYLGYGSFIISLILFFLLRNKRLKNEQQSIPSSRV